MCAVSGILLLLAAIAHVALHRHLFPATLTGAAGREHALPLAVVVLYAASIVAGIWFILPRAGRALRALRADMNLLMTVAVIGAAAIGEWFEAATVTFLFSLALLLESWSVGRARKAVEALLEIAPETARMVEPDGRTAVVPVEQVVAGAILQVHPGERIPLDGRVISGATSVNQAPITGEAAPVAKEAGSEVFAGTINNEGTFEMRVTREASGTTLARIIKLVEEAQARRAPAQQWVDRFALYYTPVMIGVALLVFLLPPLAFGGIWLHWFYQALVILIIACPCALVISTPVSIVAGLASAARAGVLIKGGVFLETVGRLKVLALDKTGTLTYGRPEVQQVVPLSDHTSEELLARAAGLESFSHHPLAAAIRRRSEQEGVPALAAEGFRALEGRGGEALIDGRGFWIGSHRLMEEKGACTPAYHNLARELEAVGQSVVAVGNEQHVCGMISVADGLRAEAPEAIKELRALGVGRVVMLTGDHGGTAQAIADAAGLDGFHANLLPEDKVDAVCRLGKEHGAVGMVGDGVNDAPALAAATVGIAMGAAGSNVAIETADVALLADDLLRLPWLFRHSRRTLAIIRQNIWFALAAKALFLALAVAGVATLWMAIAADMGVSLLVIFNSLRLLKGEKLRNAAVDT